MCEGNLVIKTSLRFLQALFPWVEVLGEIWEMMKSSSFSLRTTSCASLPLLFLFITLLLYQMNVLIYHQLTFTWVFIDYSIKMGDGYKGRM